jgi:arginine decarboxylase-like protein
MDIKVEDLESAYRQKFQHYQPEQQIVYLNELRNALNAYTYLKNTF